MTTSTLSSSLNFPSIFICHSLGLALATWLFDWNLIFIIYFMVEVPILNDDILLQTWHRINVYTCEISTIKIVFNTYLSNLKKSFLIRKKILLSILISFSFYQEGNKIIQSDLKRKRKIVCWKTGRKSIKWKMAANNFETHKSAWELLIWFFSSQTVFITQQPLYE